MLLEISLVLMVFLSIASGYVIWNLNTKQEMLEDWVEDFIQSVEKVNFDLKQADYKGSFEADDEVGTIFKQIKEIIEQLDKFKGEE